MNILEKIDLISDQEAGRAVKALAETMLQQNPEVETEWDLELKTALRDISGVKPAANTSSEGEVARAALRLAITSPEMRDRLEVYLDQPQGSQFGVATSLALIVAALVILQTRVHIKRSETGGWTIDIKKEPTSDELIKPLLEKMLGFISTGPFKK